MVETKPYIKNNTTKQINKDRVPSEDIQKEQNTERREATNIERTNKQTTTHTSTTHTSPNTQNESKTKKETQEE